MTREEAREEIFVYMRSNCYLDAPSNEACEIAIEALSPERRELVEKVWNGCSWCNGEYSNDGEITAYAVVECDGCDVDNCPNAYSSDDPCYGMARIDLMVDFCPVCGTPMTDEAVQIVMKRLEKMHETM